LAENVSLLYFEVHALAHRLPFKRLINCSLSPYR
jgi:hypothetical protein